MSPKVGKLLGSLIQNLNFVNNTIESNISVIA